MQKMEMGGSSLAARCGIGRSHRRASRKLEACHARLNGSELVRRTKKKKVRPNAVFASAAVPAQRHRGSGATGWRFRRNGIAVPAQRHRRSGATASRFRRNGVAVPLL